MPGIKIKTISWISAWSICVSLFLSGVFCLQTAAKDLTAGDVIALIQKNVNCDWAEETVDTFKTGDPNTKVTGIVSTFMATQKVLEQTVQAGCNLIITHEPTFYNHLDERDPLPNDPVIEAKEKFIRQHNLIIWRFHDHWHRHNPDGIYQGMIDFLGWRPYMRENQQLYFELPKTTLKKLAGDLARKFSADTIRVIGDPNLETTKVGLSVGAPSSISQMKMLQRDDVEILVAGETREWETVEYVRDANDQGKRKAIIILGHCLSEEAGMIYCAQWLRTFVKDIPIKFIPANNPYWAP